ncbi:MAG: 50S ribosomal protein L32e [Promethearchaeota archaeon]
MTTKRDKIKQKIQAKSKHTFRRGESWRYNRLRTTWRKPRGIEQKMRIRHRGTKGGLPKSPTVGYRTPREIRGLHPSGYEQVVVHCVGDLKDLKPKNQAVMIASKVGRKKRISLKDEIISRGFKLLNPIIAVEEEAEMEGVGGEFDLSDVDITTGDVDDIELSDEDLEDIDIDVGGKDSDDVELDVDPDNAADAKDSNDVKDSKDNEVEGD